MGYLEKETRGLDTPIARLERELELLREYRIRLIADVVTGKLDVRKAAARLPDETSYEGIEGPTEASDEAEIPDEDVAA